MLEIHNDYNAKLEIDLDQNRGKTPRIVIRDITGDGEKNFFLNPDQIKEIQNFFIGGWVEIVTKEDLKTMLECVKAGCIQANKTANAAVEVANRLSEIYERYDLNSASKGDDNES